MICTLTVMGFANGHDPHPQLSCKYVEWFSEKSFSVLAIFINISIDYPSLLEKIIKIYNYNKIVDICSTILSLTIYRAI